MGKNVFGSDREPSRKMGKLWKIHFRNVSAPIPDFVETYVDNGYTDMKQAHADAGGRGLPRHSHRGPRAAPWSATATPAGRTASAISGRCTTWPLTKRKRGRLAL